MSSRLNRGIPSGPQYAALFTRVGQAQRTALGTVQAAVQPVTAGTDNLVSAAALPITPAPAPAPVPRAPAPASARFLAKAGVLERSSPFGDGVGPISPPAEAAFPETTGPFDIRTGIIPGNERYSFGTNTDLTPDQMAGIAAKINAPGEGGYAIVGDKVYFSAGVVNAKDGQPYAVVSVADMTKPEGPQTFLPVAGRIQGTILGDAFSFSYNPSQAQLSGVPLVEGIPAGKYQATMGSGEAASEYALKPLPAGNLAGLPEKGYDTVDDKGKTVHVAGLDDFALPTNYAKLREHYSDADIRRAVATVSPEKLSDPKGFTIPVGFVAQVREAAQKAAQDVYGAAKKAFDAGLAAGAIPKDSIFTGVDTRGNILYKLEGSEPPMGGALPTNFSELRAETARAGITDSAQANVAIAAALQYVRGGGIGKDGNLSPKALATVLNHIAAGGLAADFADASAARGGERVTGEIVAQDRLATLLQGKEGQDYVDTVIANKELVETAAIPGLAPIEPGSKFTVVGSKDMILPPATVAWLADGHTIVQLEEIVSNEYQIPDPETGEMVSVWKNEYGRYQDIQRQVAEVKEFEKKAEPFLVESSEYAVGVGALHTEPTAGYDLEAMLSSGKFTEKELRRMFPPQTAEDGSTSDPVGLAQVRLVQAKTGVQQGEDKPWMDLRTGELLTASERQSIIAAWEDKRQAMVKSGAMGTPEWDKLGANPRDAIVHEPAHALQGIAESPSRLAAIPSRVLGSGRGLLTSQQAQALESAKKSEMGSLFLRPLDYTLRVLVSGAATVAAYTLLGLPALGATALLDRSVAKTAQGLLTGVIEPFKVVGRFVAAPMMITPERLGESLGMIYLVGKGGVHLLKTPISKAIVYTAARGIPSELIGKEKSTGRLSIEVVADSIKSANKKAGIEATEVEVQAQARVALAIAVIEATKQTLLSPGERSLSVIPIKGTDGMTIRYFSSEWQNIVANTLWHGSDKGLAFVQDSPYEIVLGRGSKVIRVPVPKEANTAALRELSKVAAEDMAKLDAPQIRPLKLSDATDIPASIAASIEKYIVDSRAKVYGSFVQWIKDKKAAQPHDVDLVFRTVKEADAAREYISKQAKDAGFETKITDRGVEILKDGVWVTIANVVDQATHIEMISQLFKERPYTPVDVLSKEGMITETLGTQLLNQTIASFATSAKAGTRAAKAGQIAPTMLRVVKSKGIKGAPVGSTTGYVVKSPEGGTYTDAWAALNYASGEDGAMLMILSDRRIPVQTPPKAVLAEISRSDKFIRAAEKDSVWGPSKHYRGDIETEILLSPKTEMVAPPPTADLATRLLAGGFADYFTYKDGRFVRIKAAVLRGSEVPYPTPLQLTAVAQTAVVNTLKNAKMALTHPGAVVTDIFRSAKWALTDPATGRSRSGAFDLSIPGVRDMYLEGNLAVRLKGTIRELWDIVSKDVDKEARRTGAKPGTPEYDSIVSRLSDRARGSAIRGALEEFSDVARAYKYDPEFKQKFEDLYLANLSLAAEAMMKSNSIDYNTLRDLSSSASSLLSELRQPESRRVSSLLSDRPPERPIAERPTERVSERFVGRPVERIVARLVERPVGRAIERPVERLITRRTTERPPTERPPARPPERPTTTRVPPRYPPPTEPPTKIPPTVTMSRSESALIPDGSIVWRQGSMIVDRGRLAPVWKIIEPPFTQNKPRTVFQVPHGAKFANLLTPQETIQVLGTSREVVVPESVDVYMGATQAHITGSGKYISFTKNPIKDEAVKEMLVKDGSRTTLSMDDESLISGTPQAGVNRTTLGKVKPRRISNLSEPTYTILSRVSV